MSTSIAPERLQDPAGSRTCGAACLSSVYSAFGTKATAEEIWPAIARENRFGSMASTTHLMVNDAMGRELSAMAVQARDPLQVLRACLDAKIQAIVNHRLAADSPIGHYSVVTAMDQQYVTLNDPFYQRSQRLGHFEFLSLWHSRYPNSEIAGSVLIGVAARPILEPQCWLCRTPQPAAMPCPRCKESIPLPFTSLLGCVKYECTARLWSAVCCPSCDYMLQPMGAPAAQQPSTNGTSAGTAADALAMPAVSLPAQSAKLPAVAANDPWNLEDAFAAIEKFRAVLFAIPAVARNADVNNQFQVVDEKKQQLKQAQVNYLQHVRDQEQMIAKLKQDAAARRQAFEARMEALCKPAAPLDANALARDLMKNLGL